MERDFATSSGLRIAADVVGDERRPCVLLLHGGGQTRHAWATIAQSLAGGGFQAVAVDSRGHGDSDWAPDGDYRLDAFAGDVRDVVRALPAPPMLVGASLGGLSSLLALTEAPEARAAGLVLVDVAHRFETAGAQRIADFMGGHPEGFEDPSEASAAVAEYLPHRPPPADPDGIRRNLRLRDGRWRWHWDPRVLGGAHALMDPAGRWTLQRRLRHAAARLRVPTLLVRGGSSDVITPQIAAEFVELAPHTHVVEVPRAAHMVAGDDNDSFAAAILTFAGELFSPMPEPPRA